MPPLRIPSGVLCDFASCVDIKIKRLRQRDFQSTLECCKQKSFPVSDFLLRPEHFWWRESYASLSSPTRNILSSVCEWIPGFEDGKRRKSSQFGVSAQSAMFDLVEKSINLVLWALPVVTEVNQKTVADSSWRFHSLHVKVFKSILSNRQTKRFLSFPVLFRVNVNNLRVYFHNFLFCAQPKGKNWFEIDSQWTQLSL